MSPRERIRFIAAVAAVMILLAVEAVVPTTPARALNAGAWGLLAACMAPATARLFGRGDRARDYDALFFGLLAVAAIIIAYNLRSLLFPGVPRLQHALHVASTAVCALLLAITWFMRRAS